MINKLNHIGIWVYRVTKLSRNPAVIKIGTNPITIFTPCFAPLINDTFLEYVFGNSMLLPITKPEQPAITMADISSVPCIHMVSIDGNNSPFE